MLRGFDVSAYQGNIVPVADFVIVKATEGSVYSSSRFAAQWASAKTRAKVRGAYHFARPEESSGLSQADRLLARANAVPGELLVLDLEASKLNQAKTNAWAREFGDRLRARAAGVTTVVYMGSSYAASGTGRDLSKHFDLWWYPQYPSSAATTKWPSRVSPWLPSGLTCGWTHPHIWQWTSSFNGLDANITNLTLAQLAGGGQPIPTPTPLEEDEMLTRDLKPGLGEKTGCPFDGKFTKVLFFADNGFKDGKNVVATQPVTVRYAILRVDGTWQTGTVKVGRADADKASTVQKVAFTDAKNTVAISVTRVDGDGTEPVTFTVA